MTEQVEQVFTEKTPWTLELLGETVLVMGGPFNKKPGGLWGLCLERAYMPGDANVACPDFGVPTRWAMYKGLRRFCIGILQGRARYLSGKDLPAVYVGCRGGIGRTGLAMALLVKVSGQSLGDPVKYIRAVYFPGAVETLAQKDFVTKFPAWILRWDLKLMQFLGVAKEV